MGQDYKVVDPDPRYWADCSCGEFRAHGKDLDGVMDLLSLHVKINKDTHYVGGYNSYIIHIPTKPKWYHKIFGGIKKWLRNP